VKPSATKTKLNFAEREGVARIRTVVVLVVLIVVVLIVVVDRFCDITVTKNSRKYLGDDRILEVRFLRKAPYKYRRGGCQSMQ
jgi:hypothetical protein